LVRGRQRPNFQTHDAHLFRTERGLASQDQHIAPFITVGWKSVSWAWQQFSQNATFWQHFGAFFGGGVGRTIGPGTIVITRERRRPYLVLGNGQALRYGIGLGRVGFTWSGVTTIGLR
jgi:lipoprotein-anchoring transpeptidase ErfK/SrfK